MKNFGKLLVACALVLGVSANAQTEDNPWSVTIGANAVDFASAGNDGVITNATGDEAPVFNEFFNIQDHWNYVPAISQLTIAKYMGNNVSVDVTGTFNKISQFGNKYDENGNDLQANDINDEVYIGLDLGANYHLNNLWNGMQWLDPYVRVNGGFNWIGGYNSMVAGGGLGFNFWLSDNVAIKAQSVYKNNFQEELENQVELQQPNYFQHTLGLNFSFGGKDTDGDGIFDKNDACPEVAGLEAFNGCPDTDGDGIEDAKDACPNIAGVAEFNGCVDTDGDGVVDGSDNCVDVPGLKELNGCPDTDKDGITDAKDGCPKEAGPAANNGCPWADKDGDSVLDKDDQCPDVKGTVANNGCPEVSQEVQNKLNAYAKTILFDSGKSSFQAQTYAVLQSMNAIFKDYPTANFALSGYTDSVGRAASNQLLSERRVNAVRDWFIANGVNAARLSAAGYGEANPIDSNKTRSGRANNRRVEVRLVK